MALFVNRYADWLRWIVPEEFNDSDLFRIVTFLYFIPRARICHQRVKPLLNMDGIRHGENPIV